jgi:putative SOS response-associated peptidase YedK
VCGRFVSTHTPEEIASYFAATPETPELPANFNVAPTNDVYAVVDDGGGTNELAVRSFHWGLVPLWAKDIKIASSMINARSETVAEKPAFKSVFKKYRCIIPMTGFYEWQAPGPNAPLSAKGKPLKQPMFIHRVDGEPLAVAGLWSAWRPKGSPPDTPWLHTCTVLTTAANNTMAPVHDRMPVILPATAWKRWLDPANDDIESLQELLVPAPDSLLTMHKVSTAVNNVRNREPALIDPIDDDATTPGG